MVFRCVASLVILAGTTIANRDCGRWFKSILHVICSCRCVLPDLTTVATTDDGSLREEGSIVLDGKRFPTFVPSLLEHGNTTCRLHSFTETVCAGVFYFFGLACSFRHNRA